MKTKAKLSDKTKNLDAKDEKSLQSEKDLIIKSLETRLELSSFIIKSLNTALIILTLGLPIATYLFGIKPSQDAIRIGRKG